jgi:ABC-type polysaccharide/polyol phosphate export permease
VILVTEQLPADYRPYLLWSPLAHAMQLLRSAYFEGYKSEDASAAYFFIGFGVMVIVAVMAQQSVRARAIPV